MAYVGRALIDAQKRRKRKPVPRMLTRYTPPGGGGRSKQGTNYWDPRGYGGTLHGRAGYSPNPSRKGRVGRVRRGPDFPYYPSRRKYT